MAQFLLRTVSLVFPGTTMETSFFPEHLKE